MQYDTSEPQTEQVFIWCNIFYGHVQPLLRKLYDVGQGDCRVSSSELKACGY